MTSYKTEYKKACQTYEVPKCKTTYKEHCDYVSVDITDFRGAKPFSLPCPYCHFQEEKQHCETSYKQECTYEDKQECSTHYKEVCKPSYNYEKKCTKVPEEKCHYRKVPKCHNVPQEHCSR